TLHPTHPDRGRRSRRGRGRASGGRTGGNLRPADERGVRRHGTEEGGRGRGGGRPRRALGGTGDRGGRTIGGRARGARTRRRTNLEPTDRGELLRRRGRGVRGPDPGPHQGARESRRGRNLPDV